MANKLQIKVKKGEQWVPVASQSDWNTTNSKDPSYIHNKPVMEKIAAKDNSITITKKNNINYIKANQQNVDWNENNINSPLFIKNKPQIPEQISYHGENGIKVDEFNNTISILYGNQEESYSFVHSQDISTLSNGCHEITVDDTFLANVINNLEENIYNSIQVTLQYNNSTQKADFASNKEGTYKLFVEQSGSQWVENFTIDELLNLEYNLPEGIAIYLIKDLDSDIWRQFIIINFNDENYLQNLHIEYHFRHRSIYPSPTYVSNDTNYIDYYREGIISGYDNQIVSASNVFVAGNYNRIYDAGDGCVIGSQNNLNKHFNYLTVGYKNTLGGRYSPTTNGINTILVGEELTSLAIDPNQIIVGRRNDLNQDKNFGEFIVGCGDSISNRNGFRINCRGEGLLAAQGFFTSDGIIHFSSGADYAEFFEWKDGNPENEDRRGYFVTLENDKIKFANSNTDYILGVISSDAAIIGNSKSENWSGKYLKDIYGKMLYDEIEIPKKLDENGKVIKEASIEYAAKLNPDYDPNEKYISRSERKEWAPVGLMGQLVVNDHGDCQPNSFCTAGESGYAVPADSGYRVMKRLDDSHILVLIK